MVLSKEFYDYLKELEGEDFTLNHIPYDDPRLKKLQRLAMSKKDIDYFKKRSEKDAVVNIIDRGNEFYYFEDVNWDIIKIKRKFMNLTQYEVAAKVGVSKNVYQQYETGKIRASKKRIADICIFLGLKIRERKGNTKKIDKLNLELIKKKRLEKGYNQYVFADLIGTSQGNYSGYETGKLVFSERVLKRTCEALEIDYEEVTMNAR